MNKTRAYRLFFSVLCLSPVAFGADFVPGEVLVKYRTGIVRTRAQANSLYDLAGVQSVRHFSGRQKGFEQLVLDKEDRVEEVLMRLRKNDSVEYAQPNYILHILPITVNKADVAADGLDGFSQDSQISSTEFQGFEKGCASQGSMSIFSSCRALELVRGRKRPILAVRPAIQSMAVEEGPYRLDPQVNKLYGLAKLEAVAAWEISKGSKSIIVADIDTGIDYNHEDLAFNMWRNPKPDRGDLVGYDFVHKDGLPYDDNDHGTHTAGTIGAVGGNGLGISGVSQRVSLMALKFLSSEGDGTTADAIRAIDYAVNHGAKVLSNSWGSPSVDEGANELLRDAIERAKAKGVLFISAAGNDGMDNDGPQGDYPASFAMDNQISVAATDKDDQLAAFSNYGKHKTHLGAPGVDIYSTVPGGKYKALSGSSMACPHVAGAAALLWSIHPNWNYKQIKAALLDTVDRLPGLVDKVLSGGRLNIYRAMHPGL